MKKSRSIVILFIALAVIGLDKNKVTFYVLFGNAEIEKIDVDISLDGKFIFQDSIKNVFFKLKMFEVEMNSGLHELEVRADEYNIVEKQKLFILFNQHVVIEYFSPCEEKENCFQIRNRLTKYRLE